MIMLLDLYLHNYQQVFIVIILEHTRKNKIMKLFIYGDLQKPETLEKLFNREIVGTFDSISNWIVLSDFNKGKNYLQLASQPHGVVFGRILELTDEEIKILDNYEKDYFRLELKTDGGEAVELYVKDETKKASF
jgi:gamma-glutamylcyclotransferase (GGCT)/AIG2-like uncharacterized protein YtfP